MSPPGRWACPQCLLCSEAVLLEVPLIVFTTTEGAGGVGQDGYTNAISVLASLI